MMPRALTEAEANVEIHRKGWYLALPSRPSGRWRSFGSPWLALKGNQPTLSQAEWLATAPPAPQLMPILRWGRGVSGSQNHSQSLWETTWAQAKEVHRPSYSANWTRACAVWPLRNVHEGCVQTQLWSLIKSPHLWGLHFCVRLRKELGQAQGFTAQELLPWPPASLYLPEGETQQGGRDRGPRCPHFLNSEFRPHRRMDFRLSPHPACPGWSYS